MAERDMTSPFSATAPSNAWAVLGDFLRRNGLAGAMFLLCVAMVFWSRQDFTIAAQQAQEERREWRAIQIDSNATLKLVADALARHIDESQGDTRELIRVSIADCVNRAESFEARNRCMGAAR